MPAAIVPEKVSPEKRLLVACARTRMSAAVANQIRDIAAAPLDWDFLLRAAAENSILPLLALNLPAAAPAAFSAEQFDKLKAASRAAGIRSLQFAAELVRVIEALRAEQVLVLPYKGPVIAVEAYGDLALREFDDLDLVLHQRDIPRADRVLAKLGYTPRFPALLAQGASIAGEYSYSNSGRRSFVELHTERTLRHFPVAPDLGAMGRRAITVDIGGQEVLTFAPEDTLVMLCVHGSKDYWERISWIADVSEFVQRASGIDWQRVVGLATSLKAERMMHLGLLLAARVLGMPLPSQIRSQVEGDLEAASLASEIEARLLAPVIAPRLAAEGFHYRRRLLSRGISGWCYALRLTMTPAQEDLAATKLPPGLRPLYALLRPLRLLSKRTEAQKTTKA